MTLDKKTRDSFFAVVRLGLGKNTPEQIRNEISDETDWLIIKSLSERQGLVAVVLDGIDVLSTSNKELTALLPKQTRIEWIGLVMQQYEHRFNSYIQAISDLAKFYGAHNVKMMVLKGFACAFNWPRPNHRPCGDIDIWQFGQQRQADELVQNEMGIRIDKSHHHHTVFNWRGFVVENHYDFLNIHHHKSNVGLESILKELGKDDTHCMDLMGERLFLPSANLHALFLLRHSMSNFASTRVMLRQLLDWAFLVERHGKEIDWDWLEGVLEKYGMKRLFNIFNAICVSDLGFDLNLFPRIQFDPDIKEKVLNDILSPTFDSKTPANIICRIPFKIRRWKANEWKHRLCYNESMWSAFWSGVWSHLQKPSSI